jgi:hypothetical protein
MGIPIAGNFDLKVLQPIDSRMVWTGTIGTLNNIPNKYPGLTCYVTGDKNLYVYQGSASNEGWEKIVTNNVDSITSFSSNFNITNDYNGLVLYTHGSSLTNATLVGPFSFGFNVSIVQLGEGQVNFLGGSFLLKNRLDFYRTAGPFAVTSILRVGETDTFLLYGDLG